MCLSIYLGKKSSSSSNAVISLLAILLVMVPFHYSDSSFHHTVHISLMWRPVLAAEWPLETVCGEVIFNSYFSPLSHYECCQIQKPLQGQGGCLID